MRLVLHFITTAIDKPFIKVTVHVLFITFAVTVHATLPVRSASQGVSFAFIIFLLFAFIYQNNKRTFYFYYMYEKPALSIEQQIQQLKQRGLEIKEADHAAHYLLNISYYRLSGYWWPMQADKEKHIFKPSSRFSDVMALYNFDKELRLLLFSVIEKIEISLRTKLIYYLSHEFDAWWFQDTNLFTDTKELIRTLATLDGEVERSKDSFIKEHKKKHKDDLRFPPAWKTLELTSFGNLSKLYGNLKPTIKSKDIIAEEFGTVNHTYLPSWLQSLAQIRNYCAHHSRLWNKNLPGRPKLLSKPPAPWISDVPKEKEYFMLYIHLCCMKYLLNAIDIGNLFTHKLSDLLKLYPNVM